MAMGFLEKSVAWLAGLVVEFALNILLFLINYELICFFSDIISRLFLGKPSALSGMSFIRATIHWNREKEARQRIAERAGQIRPIHRKPPPPERSAFAEVIALRKKTKQRPRSRPEFVYTVGFRLQDGEEVWLSVKEPEFRRFSEGDRGFLDFQGKRLLSFRKNAEGSAGP